MKEKAEPIPEMGQQGKERVLESSIEDTLYDVILYRMCLKLSLIPRLSWPDCGVDSERGTRFYAWWLRDG